jgi:hypothetical protein
MPNQQFAEVLSRDIAAKTIHDQGIELERLRELCLDAYAVIDVLAKGVGKIATPNGFFDLWNQTAASLERMGGKPFKARVAVTQDKHADG